MSTTRPGNPDRDARCACCAMRTRRRAGRRWSAAARPADRRQQRDPSTIYAPDRARAADPAWPTVPWQLHGAAPTAPRSARQPAHRGAATPNELQVYKGAQLGQVARRHAARTRCCARSRTRGRIAAVARQGSGIGADYDCCSTCAASNPTTRGAAVPAATIEVDGQAGARHGPDSWSARAPSCRRSRPPAPRCRTWWRHSSRRWPSSATSPAGRLRPASADRTRLDRSPTLRAATPASFARRSRGTASGRAAQPVQDPAERQVDALAHRPGRARQRMPVVALGVAAHHQQAAVRQLESTASAPARCAMLQARSAAPRPGSARRSPAAAPVRARRRCASPCSRGRRGSRFASTLLKCDAQLARQPLAQRQQRLRPRVRLEAACRNSGSSPPDRRSSSSAAAKSTSRPNRRMRWTSHGDAARAVPRTARRPRPRPASAGRKRVRHRAMAIA